MYSDKNKVTTRYIGWSDRAAHRSASYARVPNITGTLALESDGKIRRQKIWQPALVHV